MARPDGCRRGPSLNKRTQSFGSVSGSVEDLVTTLVATVADRGNSQQEDEVGQREGNGRG